MFPAGLTVSSGDVGSSRTGSRRRYPIGDPPAVSFVSLILHSAHSLHHLSDYSRSTHHTLHSMPIILSDAEAAAILLYLSECVCQGDDEVGQVCTMLLRRSAQSLGGRGMGYSSTIMGHPCSSQARTRPSTSITPNQGRREQGGGGGGGPRTPNTTPKEEDPRSVDLRSTETRLREEEEDDIPTATQTDYGVNYGRDES